jgi:hypothetical protein
MKKRLFLFLLSITLLVPSAALAQDVKISAAERKIAETINADQLSNWLHFVASDAMAGRDTPSMGLDVTAEFLKMNLQKWGFKPAGDNGTFFQTMAMTRESIDPEKTLITLGGQTYKLNDDFFKIGGNGTVENAGMVFGGNGWMVRSKNYDALSGVDVTGKIVVLYSDGFPSGRAMTQLPKGITQADLTGTRGTDYADPMTNARAKGAAGVLLIASPQAQQGWSNIRGFFSRGSLYMDRLREGGTTTALPGMLISETLGTAILAGESGTKSSETAFLINKTATVSAVAKKEALKTQNVVAVWEGSDPLLKNEMIAVGAHYDHVGTNPNAPGDDKIWNGADDDGSGTVGVLAIAEALAKSKVRPKRSILFVWHAGEEKGLLGAEYFNKFPTVDIKNVVAQLNIDMIGRSKNPNNLIPCEPARPQKPCNDELSGPNEVYMIGSEMMSSTLGAIAKGTNSSYLKMDYNYKYDDPKDPNRFFFRSDHFHYAQKGIPVIFWFTGVHEDYHQPGDHPDKIDYKKMESITRTIFMTMWKLSDLKERPKVDKQLPPELTQR